MSGIHTHLCYEDTGISGPGQSFSATLLGPTMDVILLPLTPPTCLIVPRWLPLHHQPASMPLVYLSVIVIIIIGTLNHCRYLCRPLRPSPVPAGLLYLSFM